MEWNTHLYDRCPVNTKAEAEKPENLGNVVVMNTLPGFMLYFVVKVHAYEQNLHKFGSGLAVFRKCRFSRSVLFVCLLNQLPQFSHTLDCYFIV